MIPGTTATTMALSVEREARSVARSDEASKIAPKGKKRLTAADRPRPNAGYEPYGSETGHGTVQQNRKWGNPDYIDPYAKETHNERRNPTTALTTSAEDRRSPLVHAGLDPSD